MHDLRVEYMRGGVGERFHSASLNRRKVPAVCLYGYMPACYVTNL